MSRKWYFLAVVAVALSLGTAAPASADRDQLRYICALLALNPTWPPDRLMQTQYPLYTASRIAVMLEMATRVVCPAYRARVLGYEQELILA